MLRAYAPSALFVWGFFQLKAVVPKLLFQRNKMEHLQMHNISTIKHFHIMILHIQLCDYVRQSSVDDLHTC